MRLALRDRSPDGGRATEAGSAALFHGRFQTTPQDLPEEQPLQDSATDTWLCFDGRLDNRDSLCARLGLPPTLSDARLVLAAHRRWGRAGFDELLGPFAAILYEPRHRRLTLARDVMGGRTLFLHLSDSLLVAASEERGVLAHREVEDRLDDPRIAAYLGIAELVDGATFFRGVRELLPGQVLTVTPEHHDKAWLRPVRPDPGAARGDDGERAERLFATLDSAVRCRMRAVGEGAVMMSGGLDSTSVAALAAGASERSVLAVSWIFDHFADCDERRYMAPVIERHGLVPAQVAGDDAWPLFELDAWPFNPNTPEENLYRRLTERAYDAARGAGARVMLTGMFGDHLYTGNRGWLADLWADRRFADALGDTAWHLRSRGSRAQLRAALGGAWRRRHPRPEAPPAPAWLTEEGRAHLPRPTADDGADRWAGARRPEQAGRVLGLLAARGVSAEIFHTARRGVELRNPYRDRRVVELMLGLPAYDLYRRGLYKPILRRAMRDHLPPEVLERRHPTALTSLYRRGIEARDDALVAELLEAPEAIWSRFVRRDWLLGESRAHGQGGGAAELVLWSCLCLELWLKRRREGHAA